MSVFSREELKGSVSIVIDPDFGEKIRDISTVCPVWILESPKNRLHVEDIWNNKEKGNLGVTLFNPPEGSSPEQAIIYIIDTIDMHNPEWSRLLVLGAAPTRPLLEVLSEYDAGKIEEFIGGFIYERLKN